MRRIAITGVSGYIGTQLLKRLAAHPEVEAVTGIDARTPAEQPAKLRHHLHDITQPLGDLLARERVDTLVHLAFIVRPMRNERSTERVNVDGCRHVIEASQRAGVQHVLYLSSTSAYGAHPDNPVPLSEDSPLRPNLRFQYSRDKAATDRLFQAFVVSNRGAAVTVLRGAVVLGPGGERAIGAKVFQPVMVRVAGHDPPVQYLHEDDLTDLLVRALERRVAGVYNVAGDGTVPYTQVARLARRPMVAAPKALLGCLMDATWKLRLQAQSHSGGLDFIAYPWVASNERFCKATGFAYRYSTEATIRAFVERKRR